MAQSKRRVKITNGAFQTKPHVRIGDNGLADKILSC
jgi:RNA-binding protein YhbY